MRFIRSIVVVASFAVALPLAAQEQSAKTSTRAGTIIELSDSLKLTPSPELQKSLDDLAAAVQALAVRIATDPQLRSAAFHVASGVVATAQQMVTEQSVVLQEALKTAAERIATVQAAERRQLKKAQ